MKSASDHVVFGHMHEDHSLEISLAERLPVKRALVIASGGDLAFALVGFSMEVVAVDSNPAQIELIRLKTRVPENSRELCFCGRVDRVLRVAGPFIRWLLDWPRLNPGWARVFVTRSMERVLHGMVMLVHGRAASRRLDREAIRLMRKRIERAMREPGAEGNPLLQVLIGNGFGGNPPAVWTPDGIGRWGDGTAGITLITGDIRSIMDGAPDASFGLVSVSNLPDTMEPAEWSGLMEGAGRVLAGGGYLIVRSMLRDGLPNEPSRLFIREKNAAGDRSPLCPVIWIGRRV